MFSKHHSMYNTCIAGELTADHVPILSTDTKIPVVMNYILVILKDGNIISWKVIVTVHYYQSLQTASVV